MINSIRHIYHTIGFKRFCQLTLSHNKKSAGLKTGDMFGKMGDFSFG